MNKVVGIKNVTQFICGVLGVHIYIYIYIYIFVGVKYMCRTGIKTGRGQTRYLVGYLYRTGGRGRGSDLMQDA